MRKAEINQIDLSIVDYLLGEVQRIRMMAPGKRTLFLKGRIARRLGSSANSTIFLDTEGEEHKVKVFGFAGSGERGERERRGQRSVVISGRADIESDREGPWPSARGVAVPLGPASTEPPQPSDERIRFLGRSYERRVACAEQGAFATEVSLCFRQRGG